MDDFQELQLPESRVLIIITGKPTCVSIFLNATNKKQAARYVCENLQMA